MNIKIQQLRPGFLHRIIHMILLKISVLKNSQLHHFGNRRSQ